MVGAGVARLGWFVLPRIRGKMRSFDNIPRICHNGFAGGERRPTKHTALANRSLTIEYVKIMRRTMNANHGARITLGWLSV